MTEAALTEEAGAEQAGASLGGVQVILLDHQERVLLQLRDDVAHIPFPGMWALPGGQLEPGEVPRECAVRELAEEMGLQVHPGELHALWAEQRSYGYEHTFYARRDVIVDQVELTEGERVDLFSLEQVRHMDLGYEDGAVLERFFCALREGRL